MRRTFAFALLVFALLALPGSANSQTPAADTAAVLLDVATQLEAEGRRELARSLFDLIVRRYPTSAAADEVRRRRALAGEPVERTDRGGRAELIVFGTLYGGWLGIAVPLAFEAEDPAAYGGGLLIGAPAGFLAAKSYAGRSLRGAGHAKAITWGGTWGTFNGWGWTEVLDVGEETHVDTVCVEVDFQTGECRRFEQIEYESGADASTIIPIMIAGGLGGMVAGSAYGKRSGFTAGHGATLQFGSLWGAAYGGGLAILAQGDDADGDFVLALVLIGGNLGLIGGAVAAPRLDWTVEQARLVSIAGVAGVVAGFGLDLLFQIEDGRTAMAIPMATGAIGLGLGASWASSRAREDARDDDDAGAGALLDVRGGRARWSLPLPLPTLLRDARGGRAPAVAVPLLHATF